MSYDFTGARFNPSLIKKKKKKHISCQCVVQFDRAWMASLCDVICMATRAKHEPASVSSEGSSDHGQVPPCVLSVIDFITSCQQCVNSLFCASAHRFVHPCCIMGSCQRHRLLDSGELELPSTGASNKTSSVLEGARAIGPCFCDSM